MRKYFILSAAIFLLAAGCSTGQQSADKQVSQSSSAKAKADKSANQPSQQTATSSAGSNPQVKPSGQTPTKNNPGSPDYFPNAASSSNAEQSPPPNAPPPVSMPKAPTITVTQTVEGSNFNKLSDDIPDGENAIDLLRRDHEITTTEYSGIGEFVNTIDAVKPDSKHFWAFYINGQSSNVGASSYQPKDGDKIEWKLEAIGASGE